MKFIINIFKLLKGKSLIDFLKTENGIGKIIFIGAVVIAISDYFYSIYKVYKNKRDPSEYKDPRKD